MLPNWQNIVRSACIGVLKAIFAEINKHGFTNTKQAYVISSNICLRNKISD
jgi:hypothetical protein